MTSVWTLDRELSERWDAYVRSHADSSIFHTLEWRRTIAETFGHEAVYLIAERRGDVVGVLPMFVVRSPFFGPSLCSTPFAVYGGILASDVEASEALARAAQQEASVRNIRKIELRHMKPSGLDFPTVDSYATFFAPVPDTVPGCLERIPRKARAEVRKALAKPGLSVDFDSKDVADFHRLFAENKRDLGSLVFPEALFWRTFEVMGDKCLMTRVRWEGETVASVVSFVWNGVIMPYWSGASERAEKLSANNVLYHAVMEEACRRGLRSFDFGRSRKDTGAFRFKHNQGFEPTTLHYQWILLGESTIPRISPDNPRLRWVREAFRNLPMPIARKLGAFVSSRIPV